MVPDIAAAFRILWLFLAAHLILFMQVGFAMLEVGTVQRKNIKNILCKNVIDISIAACTFYLFGYALAFGCRDDGACNDFVGSDGFVLDGVAEREGYMTWFFQFAFAATSATIVSGSVAERLQFAVYCAITFVLTGFIYPVVAHWVWGGGWLYQGGVIDFAGGAVVHIVGGVAGLVSTVALGPRHGRFEGPRFRVNVRNFTPFSTVFAGLGVLLLWFGWYGFNCGSVANVYTNYRAIELAAINTTLSPLGAVVAEILLSGIPSRFSSISLTRTFNSALAGLVSITPGCTVIPPSYSFPIGFVGGLVCAALSSFLQQLKVDDPLDAAPVHFGGGLWGMVAVGLFARQGEINRVYDGSQYNHEGLVFGGSGDLLQWQVVACLAISAWTAAVTAAVLLPFWWFEFLRVTRDVEALGLDQKYHGGMELRSMAHGDGLVVAAGVQADVVNRLVQLASA